MLLPRWEVPLWFRVAWNFGHAALTAVVGLLLLLDRRVPQDRWRRIHSPKLLIPVVVLLILVTLADALRRGVVRLRTERTERLKLDVHRALAAALVSAADHH